jgi:hypothetical protein
MFTLCGVGLNNQILYLHFNMSLHSDVEIKEAFQTKNINSIMRYRGIGGG